MSMIQIHRSALEEIIVPYHEFLRQQDKSKKIIFGFVEGKDDPCFYQGYIEYYLPNKDWSVKLIESGNPNGNKDRVLRLLDVIDWNRYPRKQTLFFVDKDLSDFLDTLPTFENLFVTDMYSIENYIVSEYTLLRTLRELYNISLLYYEEDILTTLFNENLSTFQEYTSRILYWYIYWRRQGQKPDLSSISMSDLMYIDNCKVNFKNINLENYLHQKWSLNYTPVNLDSIQLEFMERDGMNSFIRGKYLMWFFVSFINSFCKTCHLIIPSIQNAVNGCRELNSRDGVKDLGFRTRIPESLKQFLETTCVNYIREIEQAIAC